MRAPLNPIEHRQWATTLQVLVLDAVATQTGLSAKQMAFHGGTSLHLSWNSPRFSEDLDMLVLDMQAETVERCMKKIEARIRERLLLLDPAFQLAIKAKPSERMLRYSLSLSKPEVYGSAMVKLEFWKVAQDYLAGYPTAFKAPAASGDTIFRVEAPLPVATLETALADKMVAFATRPFLKWRDVFDVWWLKEQGLRNQKLDQNRLKEQFLHNLSAYNTVQGLPPAQALRLIHEKSDDDLVKLAEIDLKRFLSEELWTLYYPDVVRQMVTTTKSEIEALAASLDAPAPVADETTKPAAAPSTTPTSRK
jgi:predicted nucleotidyltransferase component of viral defense system